MRQRKSGLLLHPTSLPGGFGIGDLGPAAFDFVDRLAESRQSVWQVLPLGLPGYGGSPYDSPCSHSGNPGLISPQELVAAGWLRDDVIANLRSRGSDGASGTDQGRADFVAANELKGQLMRLAWSGFQSNADRREQSNLESFSNENQSWLGESTLFAALKHHFDGRPWYEWPADVRTREPGVLDAAARTLESECEFRVFLQFVFDLQWRGVRKYANVRGVDVFGDLPFYPAYDSADVWANQELFSLTAEGRLAHVAGVPPDLFSATGQRWGNPTYRWDRIAENSFRWWVDRVRSGFRLFDWVRLDHFRGFAGYWEIPASSATAEEGRWMEGPGAELFEILGKALGDLPLVAEDLGYITPDVRELRDRLSLPGMKVLQFGFADVDAEHLPHRFPPASIVYTGTHDNDTTRGWFDATRGSERQRVLAYTGASEDEVVRALIRSALNSVADVAILPVQDLLGLGNEARMNLPGTAHGNWAWRCPAEPIPSTEGEWLARLTEISGRSPGPECSAESAAVKG